MGEEGDHKGAQFMSVRVEPLTPQLWPAVEALFGKQGAFGGCWCIYWLVPRAEYVAKRGASAKAMFKRQVTKGPPPGVVAFIGDEAVGWLRIGPRPNTPTWNSPRRVTAPLNEADAADERVWGATCFFIKSSARGQGVMEALIKGGIKVARANGARAVEACPIDGKVSAVDAYVGVASVFARARFKEVARRKDNRPLMRLTLKPPRG
jgi:predicted GNAT family acetyltransferase